jgi:excisionase family DNA binding protein
VEGLVMEEQKATRRRRAPRQEWDDAQDKLMRENWPKGGLRAVRPLFPTRPDGSLQKRARTLGLKVDNRAPIRRQDSTDWIDAQIRREWAGGAPDIQALAKRIDRKYGWVKWRAGELGVRRSWETDNKDVWIEAEDRIVEHGINECWSITRIQRHLRAAGYRRSPCGIRNRVWQQHGGFSRSYYTAQETAVLFGVSKEVVYRWIETGKLRARRAPGVSVVQKPENGGFYHVSPDAVSTFMRQHVGAWDHRRMRKEVLMDFLIGHDKALGRLDELREARAA